MSAPAQKSTVGSDREYLAPAQRFGEMIALVLTALVIAFFWHHWTTGTGFFTTAFGSSEQVWFFSPMFFSLAAPAARIIFGRRNAGRPFEIVTDVLMVIGAIWLLRVFPFDFSHLGDALPAGLAFLLNWVPDWLGRVGLVLQLVGGAIAAIVTMWQFARHSARQ